MLLKRSIILAAGVLLFIAAYIIYFDVSKMQMEDRFNRKFGYPYVFLNKSTEQPFSDKFRRLAPSCVGSSRILISFLAVAS